MTEPQSTPGAKRAIKTYSLLGSPLLIYRSLDVYSSRNIEVQQPQESHLKNLQVNLQALNRTRARWYYPMDHRFRLTGPINSKELEALLRGIWLQAQGYNPRVRNALPAQPSAPQPDEAAPHADDSSQPPVADFVEESDDAKEEKDLVQPEDLERGTGLQHLEALGEGIELSDDDMARNGGDDNDDDEPSKKKNGLGDSSDEEDDYEAASDDEEQPTKRKRKRPTKKTQDEVVKMEDKTPKPKQRYNRLAPKRERSELSWNRIVQGYKLTRTDILYREDFQRTRTLPNIDHARLTMLEAAKEDGLHIPFTLSTYRMFDHTYIPGLYGARLKPRLQKYRFENSRLFAQERRNFADPAYLAPFARPSLEYAFPKRRKLLTSYNKQYPVGRNDPNSPSMYGNCLVCETCPCPPCRTFSDNASRCLVYPAGELLDRVRVAKLVLPNTLREDSISEIMSQRSVKKGRRTKTTVSSACDLAELDIEDTIREIAKCGVVESRPRGGFVTLVVRSACFVTVVRWTALETLDLGYDSLVGRSEEEASGCWRFYKLEKMHCIDLRFAEINHPSYMPLDVTCHAKSGGAYSDRKIAILTQTRTTRNTIYHVSASDYSTVSPLIEQHTIPCLSSISKIDFTSSHPMTLWAAANSYVRPAITEGILQDGPYAGNGHSLFLIDLRNDSATFQWSPSSEEFETEGFHSISGIMTDWDKENRLWVSSVSAGKTWELDSRMPCKVVSSWSLPGSCDDFGSVLPVSGLHGDGSILTKPCQLHNDDDFVRPILSVGKSPGSYGLHLYQPNVSLPRFQTQSLEVAGCAIPSRFSASYVASSCFPLPDVSDRVFTCGLAAFRTPTEYFLTKSDLNTVGCSLEESKHVLSALTMTNKGDIYLHALLEQSSTNRTAQKIRDCLSVGSSAFIVPTNQSRVTISEKDDSVGFSLKVSLSNVPPLPNSAVAAQTVMAQEDIQPFRSIPLCQPASSTNPPSDWRPVSHARIGPPVGVRGRNSTIEEQSLLLPPYDFDDPVLFGNVKMKEDPGARPKSDVTSDILASAAMLWGNSNRHI